MTTQQLTKQLNRIEHRLRETQSELAQTRYRLRQSTSEFDARVYWMALAGMWKGKFKENPVKWQRRIRAEWDRAS